MTRVEYSEQSVSLVSDLGWLGEVLPSFSAKLLVKSASTFLSAFRLLPRLEGVYIQRVFRPAATLRRIVVYQLAGWAGKWNAVPLTLNKKEKPLFVFNFMDFVFNGHQAVDMYFDDEESLRTFVGCR